MRTNEHASGSAPPGYVASTSGVGPYVVAAPVPHNTDSFRQAYGIINENFTHLDSKLHELVPLTEKHREVMTLLGQLQAKEKALDGLVSTIRERETALERRLTKNSEADARREKEMDGNIEKHLTKFLPEKIKALIPDGEKRNRVMIEEARESIRRNEPKLARSKKVLWVLRLCVNVIHLVMILIAMLMIIIDTYSENTFWGMSLSKWHTVGNVLTMMCLVMSGKLLHSMDGYGARKDELEEEVEVSRKLVRALA